ncbi:hypothetical protein GCK32_015328 [Trichostrongylus colubriformis]|uniref:DUF5641 domain-containing protein n=1 Tax=Trichostrongylus colubriformis TaxID=6319 RepID=A0AAN8F7P4_TRICO
MTSLARTKKSLLTRRLNSIAEWLEDSERLLIPPGETEKPNRIKDLRVALRVCEENIATIESSLHGLGEAFENISERSAEDDEKFDKYVESANDMIIKLVSHKAKLLRIWEDCMDTTDQETVARGPRTEDQRQLFEKLSAIAAQLKDHGEHLDNYLAVHTFLHKFHGRIQKAATKRCMRHEAPFSHQGSEPTHQESDNDWTLELWLSTIDSLISEEERLQDMLPRNKEKDAFHMPQNRGFSVIACECCKLKGHRWSTCPKIPTPHPAGFLLESNRCLKCGSNAHRVASCTGGNCRKCHQKHHTAICTKSNGQATNAANLEKRNVPRMVQQQQPAKPSPTHSAKSKLSRPSKQHVVTVENQPLTQKVEDVDDAVVLQVNKRSHDLRNKVILLVGSTEILDAKNMTRKATVLLDTGSELSFIREDFAQELGLPVVDRTSLMISTFGTEDSVARKCDVSTLQIRDVEGGESAPNLVMAKSKLASIKTAITVPKLEMNAITLGARVAHFVYSSMSGLIEIQRVLFFTDSEIVLGWMKASANRQAMGVLVANRLKEVRRIVDNLEAQGVTVLFGHIPTALNPADCATRGLTSASCQEHFWWNGPQFIHGDITKTSEYEKMFPLVKSQEEAVGDIDAPMAAMTLITLQRNEMEEPTVFRLARFSSLYKAKRVVAYVHRFIHRLLQHFPLARKEAIFEAIPALRVSSSRHEFTDKELREAKNTIIRDHQKALVDSHRISSQKELNIQPDQQGILRCYGRLDRAAIPVPAMTPIFIVPKTALARLIIEEAHTQYHCGVAHTMATVRQTFWIPKLRQQAGDIVLLGDASQPRNTWKIGRIIELRGTTPDSTQEVVVELPNKSRVRRPVNRIVPLEVSQDREISPSDDSTKSTSTSAEQPSRYNLRKRKHIFYGEEDIDGSEIPCHTPPHHTHLPPSAPSPCPPSTPTPRPYRNHVNLIKTMPFLLTIIFFSSLIGTSTANDFNNTHHLQCTEGGVVVSQKTRHQFEICSEDYCLTYKHPRNEEVILFPPHIVLHEHVVKWKIFDGNDVDVLETICAAAPFCTQIDCTFCVAIIANPESYIRADSALLFSLPCASHHRTPDPVHLSDFWTNRGRDHNGDGHISGENRTFYGSEDAARNSKEPTSSPVALMKVHNFRISPNQPRILSPTTITLSSITVPPTPLLNSAFVADRKRTALAPHGYVPPLRCGSREKAENMTCDIVEDCHCHPAEIKMLCDCKDFNLTAHMLNPEYQLPILRPHVEFRMKQNLIARIPQLPTAEFILRIKDEFRTTLVTSDAICTAKSTQCTGCYNCGKGARAEIICTSSTPEARAEIQCDDYGFVVPCTSQGAPSELHFFSNRAQFYANCSIQCGTVRHSFEIVGILRYTGILHPALQRLLDGESEVHSEINFPDIGHIIDVFLRWSGTLLITIVIVLLALLVSYLFITNGACLCIPRLLLRFMILINRLFFRILRTLVCSPLRLLCYLYRDRKRKLRGKLP